MSCYIKKGELYLSHLEITRGPYRSTRSKPRFSKDKAKALRFYSVTSVEALLTVLRWHTPYKHAPNDKRDPWTWKAVSE